MRTFLTRAIAGTAIATAAALTVAGVASAATSTTPVKVSDDADGRCGQGGDHGRPEGRPHRHPEDREQAGCPPGRPALPLQRQGQEVDPERGRRHRQVRSCVLHRQAGGHEHLRARLPRLGEVCRQPQQPCHHRGAAGVPGADVAVDRAGRDHDHGWPEGPHHRHPDDRDQAGCPPDRPPLPLQRHGQEVDPGGGRPDRQASGTCSTRSSRPPRPATSWCSSAARTCARRTAPVATITVTQ